MSLTHLDGVALADGGMETTLIFHDGHDLPHFAAFTLLAEERGRRALASYYDSYLAVAEEHGLPIVLATATWRASFDWGALLGYSEQELADAIGPRGDGYVTGVLMRAHEAERYHEPQVEALAGAGVDLVSAVTMTYAEEPIGIAGRPPGPACRR